MLTKILLTSSAALLLNVVQATIGLGSCPTPALQENFDAAQYLGRWYELKRDKYLPFEWGAECVVADYSLVDATTLGVHNLEYNSITGKN